MGNSWEFQRDFIDDGELLKGKFFHGDEWLMWFMVSIKSAASQRFDSKKYDGNMKAPGQRNAYFRLLKTSISWKSQFPAFAQQTITCPTRVRFARCSLPRAAVSQKWEAMHWVVASWLLPTSKGTGRTGRIKRRKVSTIYVGIESITWFSIYPIYLMLLSQYMVNFGIDGE